MQTVLITGGAGFIGSSFIPYFLENNKELDVVNLDLLTYAGDLSNLEEVINYSNYTFVEGDICDRALIENLFKKYNFTGVIHFAAESHVDNSIKNPDNFIKTNVFGTFTILDVAKNQWMDDFNNNLLELLDATIETLNNNDDSTKTTKGAVSTFKQFKIKLQNKGELNWHFSPGCSIRYWGFHIWKNGGSFR